MLVMLRPVKALCAALVTLWTLTPLHAAPEPENEVKQVENLQQAIPEAIKALVVPRIMDFPGGITMAVGTPEEVSQKHVLQGLNHLHGGWEFEASRHFAVAMRKDPDCLMAHWGMAMAMLDAGPETAPARKAVIERLVALLDAGKGTELERGYAYGLLKYLTEGADGAANSFRKVAERYPNELQAAIFAALFSRGGYDFTGEATPDQQQAEKKLLALIEKHPDSPIPINALLTIRAEAPELKNSLPLARKLTKLWPAYPPAFHTLGHYEWRSGNHARAAAAFGRAVILYQNWMRQNALSVADCPEWPKAESYRVVALLSMGDYETAHAAAKQVAAIPLPAGRLASPGARMLLWEAKTLPARILIDRGLKDSFVEAGKSLPTIDEVKPSIRHSNAYLWIDGLRLALKIQELIDEKEFGKARAVASSLALHIEKFEAAERNAASLGERSQWLRASRALNVLLNDIRGRIAAEGPPDLRPTAFNWYSSAVDYQSHASMLYPPMLLTPMSARLGDFFLAQEEPEKALEHYENALRVIPRDIHSLQGLRKAYIAIGDTDRPLKIELEIEKLKNP